MGTRANIHLDDDAYGFAVAYARARDMPLGAAVSELLRQRAAQDQTPLASASPRLRETPEGLLVIASRGKVITPEMAKEAAEDDLD